MCCDQNTQFSSSVKENTKFLQLRMAVIKLPMFPWANKFKDNRGS